MRTTTRNISCTIPDGEFSLFKKIADSMGWTFSVLKEETAKKRSVNCVRNDVQDMKFILSLHAEGGTSVPADENSMDALAESKFIQK